MTDSYDNYGNLAWSSFEAETIFRSMDEVGNIYATKEHKDREYGKDGRLLKNKDTIYEYDELGNLSKKITKDGTWQYKYYGNGLMSKVIRPDRKEVSFKYDGLRRFEKNFNGKRKKFLWDGESETTQNAITWIFEEDGFVPFAKITEKEMYSIVSDHLGTPTEMYDESGKKTWSSELDIYGRVKKQDGDYDSCFFRYQGQYEDEETGLYYNRFRYYSPEDGQYTQSDPIGLSGGNPTLYGYVHDPNSWIDPFGLISIFRSMKETNGLPKVEQTARGLGARPGIDIPVENGKVKPNTGGISVAPSPTDLPEHRRPADFGGTGKDPVWSIDTDDLGPDLKYVPDSSTHGTIQPSRDMNIDEYQDALSKTQNDWTKIERCKL